MRCFPKQVSLISSQYKNMRHKLYNQTISLFCRVIASTGGDFFPCSFIYMYFFPARSVSHFGKTTSLYLHVVSIFNYSITRVAGSWVKTLKLNTTALDKWFVERVEALKRRVMLGDWRREAFARETHCSPCNLLQLSELLLILDF